MYDIETGYLADDEGKNLNDIIHCGGFFISRQNGKIIKEISITKRKWCGVYHWQRLNEIPIISDREKDFLTSFFMNNPNKLLTDNLQRNIREVKGVYVHKLITGEYDVKVYINTGDNTHANWFVLDIFNTDLNNHISFFLLHL